MPTINTPITATWTKIAAAADTELLATYNSPVGVDLAVTAADAAPTVEGHRLTKDDQISRAAVGTGFVWVKVAPGSVPTSIVMAVTK